MGASIRPSGASPALRGEGRRVDVLNNLNKPSFPRNVFLVLSLIRIYNKYPLRFLHRMLYRPSSTRPLPQTPRLSVLTIVKIPGRLLCSPTSWRVTTGRVLCVAVRCGRGAHVHTSGANDKNRGYPRAPPNTICVLQADLIDRQLDPLLHCEYLWRRERERARAQPCAAPSYC